MNDAPLSDGRMHFSRSLPFDNLAGQSTSVLTNKQRHSPIARSKVSIEAALTGCLLVLLSTIRRRVGKTKYLPTAQRILLNRFKKRLGIG